MASSSYKGFEIVNGQARITEPASLLTDDGILACVGYATSPLLEYDRTRIAASKLRVKEWDYYLVHDEYALAFTISDMSYLSLVSVSLIDFAKGTSITNSAMGALPLGRLGMPVSSTVGVTSFANRRVAMAFEVAKGMRRLTVSFKNFDNRQPLIAEIVLDQEPRDSMVIATPWAEDFRAFFYNRKTVGMRAIGEFSLGGFRHTFSDTNSFGLLDWGRGVWTRDNTWYWSAAQGWQNGRRFGMNLGYGFGDTAAASENMLFVDGVAHKLRRVDFGIPVRNAHAKTLQDRYDLMAPWHMTDDKGRLDLTFTPDIDRCDFMDYKLIISDQHQVFGHFNGSVTLDDGSLFKINDLRGFAEAVHNVY